MRTVLIASRGEIACRIIRTCRRMGLRSVAVYSDADAGAPHARLADAAVRIGPAEAARSYLDADAILGAAQVSGADAIHPGYGFLSERAVLPLLCAEHGLTWIGPSVACIERMGSKIEAKRIARTAGVACVPGYDGDDQSEARLASEASAIGYPVLVKASAGGGGRGMRRVDTPDELAEALAAARAEARAAFGSPALLIEKLIERPRHLEVQLAGDRHGNLVHLFERECSIQRNFQKLIEEAPAPRLSDAVRNALTGAALRLGRAIGYDSLGTVEFILEDGGEESWFLEMNTRLQVEHTVTEQVTGLDMVEWQIRVARGEALPARQDGIAVRGAAIEARLNAEDPEEGYRPGVGTLLRFDPPSGDGVRVDTGVCAGTAITPHYDNLLAKVIAHGADRDEAVARLGAALERMVVLGVITNQALLHDTVEQPRFRTGELTTRFLDEAFPNGWRPATALASLARDAAVAAWMGEQTPKGPGPWATLGGFRLTTPAGRPARLFLLVENRTGSHRVEAVGTPARFESISAGEIRRITARRDRDSITVEADGIAQDFAVATRDGRILLSANGHAFDVRVMAEIERVSATSSSAQPSGASVMAAMPGLVSAVEVEVGHRVAQGQTVVVMEAMKVVLRLPAPAAGRVARVLCGPGETVRSGAVLVEIEPD